MYKRYLKRLIDSCVSGILFITLIPLLLFICLMVFLFLDRNVFFIQKRTGKFGVVFDIFKIRTLPTSQHNFKDYHHWLSSFLRKSGLDEIPQLINIFYGQMSFIGPRPLLPEYLNKYNHYQQQRLMIKPGLTGLAQIKGFNKLSWSHRFRYDVFYVKKESFLLDISILMKTLLIFVSFKRFNKEQPLFSEKFN